MRTDWSSEAPSDEDRRAWLIYETHGLQMCDVESHYSFQIQRYLLADVSILKKTRKSMIIPHHVIDILED